MNKAIKEDWCEALRSGDHVQAVRALDTENGQCCLGVLLDIIDAPYETSKVFLGSDMGEKQGRQYNGFSGHLPLNLRERLGISEAEEQVLISLNDKHRASFAEIADYIEATT